MPRVVVFFFFNDPATTEIYTLSLHDALPIFVHPRQHQYVATAVLAHDRGDQAVGGPLQAGRDGRVEVARHRAILDRKSTRLNLSHANISYAVFCLKKKQQIVIQPTDPIPSYT